MSRKISDHEMSRRALMARAKLAITDAMTPFIDDDGLTPMEWVNVLHEAAARMIGHGLRDEWQEQAEGPGGRS